MGEIGGIRGVGRDEGVGGMGEGILPCGRYNVKRKKGYKKLVIEGFQDSTTIILSLVKIVLMQQININHDHILIIIIIIVSP